MALKINEILNLLVENKTGSPLMLLTEEYCTLKQKLENLENQSWYFKKALASHQKKVVSIENEYQKIRYLFNTSNLDSFIQILNECNETLTLLGGPSGSLFRRIRYYDALRKIDFFNELIRLKGKTEVLEPVNHYFHNPSARLLFWD